MRYRVHGVDEETGETIELTVEADTIGGAEERAALRGFTARRVELLDGAADPQPDNEIPTVSQQPPATSPDEVFQPEAQPAAPVGEKEPERDIWTGGPSQWVNTKRFMQAIAITVLLGGAVYVLGRWPLKEHQSDVLMGGLPIALLPGLAVSLWAWAHTRAKQFQLTSERVRCRQGIFTRHIEEIELYRVKDIEITQTMWQRMTRLGTVVLVTDDATCPRFVMASVPHHETVRDRVRSLVEKRRVERRFEVIGAGEGGPL
ncbi:MAG: PH domain-containing protein [Planctomycetota bacterium]|jgi:membrane protein YdbS with pleckstrin-like domain